MSTQRTLSLAAVLLALTTTPLPAPAQTLGDSKVIAEVPLSGFPEGIATRGNRFYVAGPAAFGLPLGSAFVLAYDIRTGALEDTFPITITNPFGDSAPLRAPTSARTASSTSSSPSLA